MRVLIDECLNWRLGRALPGHYAVSVGKMGWSGVKNGHLISLAVENGFDVFLTGDRNLSFQQNLHGHPLAVIVLAAQSTQLRHTLPLNLDYSSLFPKRTHSERIMHEDLEKLYAAANHF